MAGHGENNTLDPASDSHRESEDAESVVCYSMGQAFFMPLCIC